jgi:excisionase family DNA binding protein
MTKMTTGQVADRLQVSSQTVLRLIRAGEIKAERLTGVGKYRILEADLLDYAAKHNVTLLPEAQPK